MDIESFNDIHNLVHKNLQTIKKTRGFDICSQIRLAVKIPYLDGCSLWDIHDNFGWPVCEFYRSVWLSTNEINSPLSVKFDIKDVATLAEM